MSSRSPHQFHHHFRLSDSSSVSSDSSLSTLPPTLTGDERRIEPLDNQATRCFHSSINPSRRGTPTYRLISPIIPARLRSLRRTSSIFIYNSTPLSYSFIDPTFLDNNRRIVWKNVFRVIQFVRPLLMLSLRQSSSLRFVPPLLQQQR